LYTIFMTYLCVFEETLIKKSYLNCMKGKSPSI
jgi:hypothetical protein